MLFTSLETKIYWQTVVILYIWWLCRMPNHKYWQAKSAHLIPVSYGHSGIFCSCNLRQPFIENEWLRDTEERVISSNRMHLTAVHGLWSCFPWDVFDGWTKSKSMVLYCLMTYDSHCTVSAWSTLHGTMPYTGMSVQFASDSPLTVWGCVFGFVCNKTTQRLEFIHTGLGKDA